MKTDVTPKNSAHRPETHGLYALEERLKKPSRKRLQVNIRKIDKRTSAGRALKELEAELVTALGGRDKISPHQWTLIRATTGTTLLLQRIDSWLLQQDGPPVDKRHRRLLPIVGERSTLIDNLIRLMNALGVEQKANAPTLEEMLREGTDEAD